MPYTNCALLKKATVLNRLMFNVTIVKCKSQMKLICMQRRLNTLNTHKQFIFNTPPVDLTAIPFANDYKRKKNKEETN